MTKWTEYADSYECTTERMQGVSDIAQSISQAITWQRYRQESGMFDNRLSTIHRLFHALGFKIRHMDMTLHSFDNNMEMDRAA